MLIVIKKMMIRKLIKELKICDFQKKMETKHDKEVCRFAMNSWKYYLKQVNDKKAMM